MHRFAAPGLSPVNRPREPFCVLRVFRGSIHEQTTERTENTERTQKNSSSRSHGFSTEINLAHSEHFEELGVQAGFLYNIRQHAD
jgi:hypothetical protein